MVLKVSGGSRSRSIVLSMFKMNIFEVEALYTIKFGVAHEEVLSQWTILKLTLLRGSSPILRFS